jgi:hypothetical protein
MLRFGHSHLVVVPLQGLGSGWRRKGKMRLLLFGSSRNFVRRLLAVVCRWRPANIYHGRGLRLSRQQLVRKGGKVSAYR